MHAAAGHVHAYVNNHPMATFTHFHHIWPRMAQTHSNIINILKANRQCVPWGLRVHWHVYRCFSWWTFHSAVMHAPNAKKVRRATPTYTGSRDCVGECSSELSDNLRVRQQSTKQNRDHRLTRPGLCKDRRRSEYSELLSRSLMTIH